MSSPSGTPVIITFKEGATDDDKAKVRNSITQAGGTIGHEYELINSVSARLNDAQTGLVSLKEEHLSIEDIELDGIVTTQDEDEPN
ncbi:hypothetical protein H4R19_005802 [Coemansia spiralis]|nr:hypothetical protein H4R19_005802 [Coemansia spiralis]